MAAITVYHYPNCGTCKKARRWLEAEGIEHRLVDLVADPIPLETLRSLVERSGLEVRRFFNTSGQSYRQGAFKERLVEMSHDDALAALAADGKLVKRPIVDTAGAVLVGFRPEEWAEALGA